MQKDVDREVDTTKRWSIGIIITIVVQTIGIAWWAASLNAQVAENSKDIDMLQTQLANSSALILSREQIDDILLVRDTKIESIEQAVKRIEIKLDRIR